MAFLNRATIMGNLGCDPEIRYFADNTPTCRFTVATKKTWKDPNGNNQEKTTWHTVIFTGDIVTRYIEPYVGVGDLVLVEGEINNYSFIGKDGLTKYVSEIIGKTIQIIIKRKDKDPNLNDDGTPLMPY